MGTSSLPGDSGSDIMLPFDSLAIVRLCNMRLKIEKRYPVREFGLFGVVGGLATGLQYLIMAMLVQAFGIHPAPASAAGFSISAVANYALNYRLTFKSTKPHAACAPRFAVVSISGLVLTFVLMLLFVDLLGIHYILSQLLTTLIVLFWNFLLNYAWSFREVPVGN